MDRYELLREATPDCMVLLKQDGTFPLNSPCAVALYGNGARKTLKGGTGSGDVNLSEFPSVEDGFRKAGFLITTKEWLDAYETVHEESYQAFLADLKARAKAAGVPAILFGMGANMPEPEYDIPLTGKGDTAIYVLSRVSGEGADRRAEPGALKLTRTEIRDILQADRFYENFLLVLNVGGVVDLTPVKNVSNILVLSQPGMTVGDSLADVVLGKKTPSGKLSATWSSAEDYPAIGSFGEQDDTDYREGIYVGYRYFDTVGKEPLFPFGYGLSYTTFTWEPASVLQEDTELRIRAVVKNTGKHPGKEVLQVYVSVPSETLDQPFQTLAAFGKTRELAPGEEEILDLRFDLCSLASYDERSSQEVLEAGEYIVRLGNSSRHTEPCAVLRLKETVSLAQYRTVGGPFLIDDWKPNRNLPTEAVSPEVPRLDLDRELFPPLREIRYDRSPMQIAPAVKEQVAAMSDEDLRYLCVGGFQEEGSKSVIGAAGFDVAGAAGESTSRFRADGIPNLVMADGPAGLRLSRTYGVDENGVWPIGDAVPAAFRDLLDEATIHALGLDKPRPERQGEVREHDCSAIPIGTAIAQSFDIALAESLGDLVGEEMERYGVDIWLAPALNIQRSPLCGRNFEYYSEDPLLSGKMAAAMTRGVQKHPGRAVCIKHFCCNNQETNRFHSNSIVSERALREIYLRGFRIAVEESCPHTLMTSYNLLNGIHTSERRDLNTDVLRMEWGFEGLVLSDWVAHGFSGPPHKWPSTTASASIASGNDLMMPGGPEDVEDLKKADRTALEECAARVIALAKNLKGRT